MKLILPLAAALMLGAAPALADHENLKDGPGGPGPSLYDRISAHYGPMGRDVKEEYRDGPCKITREWETDGDYYERIKCRGPRHWRD
ncbi:hypothetical protein [Hyphomicrobium sp.]|uniref:hypothetical protein n=1 Tax=Hyphomicrobium sp. TaxID=82 RepID=UPI0025BBE8A1|nr:hypothetical protein [Hyphomicrobium sp.]MCC7252588.1 hypothetical protein [Hyphomicrobium sp.]